MTPAELKALDSRVDGPAVEAVLKSIPALIRLWEAAEAYEHELRDDILIPIRELREMKL